MLRPPEMALIIVVGVLFLGCWSVTMQAAQAGIALEHKGSEAPLPYKEEFIPVEENVKLQVLDWGGTGRPVILLAGLGYDAHEWDSFAPKLVPQYHVYAVTRRGFGASSAPKPDNTDYSANRLGDDVLAVMDALKINRPIVAKAIPLLEKNLAQLVLAIPIKPLA